MADESRDKRKPGAQGPINLGLSDLIGHHDHDSDAITPSKTEKRSPGIDPSAIFVFGDPSLDKPRIEAASTTAEPLSAYEKLATEGNWSELSDQTERVISAKGEGEREARLWWIRAQLKQGSMPLAVLAAPLEATSQAILEAGGAEKTDPLATLCTKTLDEAATACENVNDWPSATRYLELLYQFDSSAGSRLGHSLESELQSLEGSGSRRQHKAQLERREKIKARIKELGPVEEYKTPLPDFIPGSTKMVSGLDSRKMIVGGGVLIFFLFLLPLYYLFVIARGDRGMDQRADDSLRISVPNNPASEGATPAGMGPSLDRVGGVSQLDAVLYDVNKLPTPKSEPRAVENEPITMEGLDSGEAKPSTVPEARLPRQKEVVDTSGPTESRSIEDARRGRGDDRSYDDRRDSSRDSRDDRRDDSRRRRDDRDRGRGDGDGSFESRETDQSGDMYEVLINTTVMESASYRAKEMGYLYAGDKVLVDARIGRWLRVISRKGIPGYISAQDAERLSN